MPRRDLTKGREYNRKWMAAHPERRREWQRKWTVANRERKREYNRRAAIRHNFTVEGRLCALCRGFKRRELNPVALVGMFHSQKGRCAISGVEMTWGRGRGHVPTHVSIDRIEPGGVYSIENVQLVCFAVNMMKSDIPQSEFIWWCKNIARTQQ